MSDGPNESYESRRQNLAAVLSRCTDVTRHEPDGEWDLAHALLDLEQSFMRFTEELLPKLEKTNLSSDEICDVLHTIGEEFRHVLYHIGDSTYFGYLPRPGGTQHQDESEDPK